ncbi:phosphatase PAP2 family protein [Candidatus Margulisiibacteriota bacterium]
MKRYFSVLILIVCLIFIFGNSTLAEKSQYLIVDDLTDFAADPFDAILKQQSIYMWFIPPAILLAFDHSLYNQFEDNMFLPLRKDLPASIFASTVKTNYIFESMQMAFLSTRAIHNDKLAQYAYLSAETVIDAWIVSQTLKHCFGRARPEPRSDKGPYSWGNFNTEMLGGETSFPSTHTTVYFAYATILGKVLEQEWMSEVLGSALYFLEIGPHHHWLSDMCVSYLLGKSIAEYVWSKRDERDYKSDWFISPIFYYADHKVYPGFRVWKFL